MHGLATRIMLSPLQAALLAALFVVLSLLFPPFSLLSAATVGLRTLRNGVRDGALVMGMAGLICLLIGALALQGGWTLALVAIGLWVPTWVLGGVLRYSRSLPITITAGVLLGGVLILAYHLGRADAVNEWREMLAPVAESLDQAKLLEPGGKERLIEVLSRWMTGILATAFFLQAMLGLLLARWWQALLYNPGGFRQEFHELRLPRALAALTFALLLVNVWLGSGDGGVLEFFALLLLTAFLLQGVALVHGLAGRLEAKTGWLVAFYLIWLFVLPQMVMALATAGMVDAWFDFRARLAARAGAGGKN
jgi:hypothetical protein